MDEEEVENKFISDKYSEESYEDELEVDDGIARRLRYGHKITKKLS